MCVCVCAGKNKGSPRRVVGGANEVAVSASTRAGRGGAGRKRVMRAPAGKGGQSRVAWCRSEKDPLGDVLYIECQFYFFERAKFLKFSDKEMAFVLLFRVK